MQTRRLPFLGRRPMLALGVLVLAACATPAPVTQVGLNRDTPEATYEYFKTVATNNQWAAEWAVFSPNFKRAVNQEVGRVIDLGDYITARQTVATNSNAEMQMLLSSTLAGVQNIGPDRARVTVSAGGRSISPQLIRLTKWELRIRGEDEPATGFIASAGEAISVNTDGSITVRVQASAGAAAYLRTVPRDRIESFVVKAEWYVDDFGGLEAAVGSGASSGEPQPGAYPPPSGPGGAPTAPPPSSFTGSGSPDG